jgi:hypothetical protein
MNTGEPIVAFAVRCAAGVSLHLTQPAAIDYAARHHGTVCRLVEWIDPIDNPPPARSAPAADTPLTGLVRI